MYLGSLDEVRDDRGSVLVNTLTHHLPLHQTAHLNGIQEICISLESTQQTLCMTHKQSMCVSKRRMGVERERCRTDLPGHEEEEGDVWTKPSHVFPPPAEAQQLTRL